jgi:hypothetical protein
MASIIKVDTIQDQDGNNIINENANTITIGKSGDTVQVATGATLEGAGTQWQSDIKTSAFTAVAGEGYWINTTSATVTMTLPASASVGDTIEFSDYARTWNTNNVTVNQNSLKYQGGTYNPVYDVNGQSVRIVYSGVTQGWIPTSDDDVTNEGTAPPYSAEYLVVAGGGSGGYSLGGGGGAGGYLTNYSGTAISLTVGEVYTATVGAGGVAPTSDRKGFDGSDSVLSGTGITTVTSFGGGGGGSSSPSADGDGEDGGSGGGAGYVKTSGGGSGTVGQGNNGGAGFGTSPNYGCGGGGGASQSGANGTSSAGGDGGDGSSNSITGSSVAYGGGGGGAVQGPSTQGTGGTGGGGNGEFQEGSANATAGTTNTGGGGGGGRDAGVPGQTGQAGGSGIVILRVPTANYSGTTTGSPTISTSGSDTIIKFTGSGTYTG